MTELLYLIAFEFYLISLYLISWYYLTGWWENPTVVGVIIQAGFFITSVAVLLFNRFWVKPYTTGLHVWLQNLAKIILFGSVSLLLIIKIFFSSHAGLIQIFDHWTEIGFIWLVCCQIIFGQSITTSGKLIIYWQKIIQLFERYGLVCAFLLLTIAKITLLSQKVHNFVVLDDTYTYWQMAKHLFLGDFSIAQFNHYPPLYPLALIPALWFDSLNIYTHTTILNSIYSSTTIFPLYFLARQFFSKQKSLLLSITSAFYLYHLIFPGLIMSENIALPLFFWAVYFAYSKPPKPTYRSLWNILFGVSCGLFWLSRYLALPIIPILFFVRYMRDQETFSLQNLLPDKQSVIRVGLALGITLVIESFWIIPGLEAGVPLKNLLGFQIASNRLNRQITLSSVWFWSGISVSYFILMLVPLLPALANFLLSPLQSIKKIKIWDITVILLSFLFLITVTRHAFRAGYNASEPIKFVGRYIFYLTPLIWLSAFQTEPSEFKSKKTSILAILMATSIFLVAYLNLFHPGSFILDDLHPFLSPDMVIPWMLGGLFVFLVIVYFLISMAFSTSKSTSYKELYLASFLVISNLAALSPVQLYIQSIHRNGYLLDKLIQTMNTDPVYGPFFTESKQLAFYISDDPDNFPKELEVRGLSARVDLIEVIKKDPLAAYNCKSRIILTVSQTESFGVVSDSDKCNHAYFSIIQVDEILSDPVFIVHYNNPVWGN